MSSCSGPTFLRFLSTSPSRVAASYQFNNCLLSSQKCFHPRILQLQERFYHTFHYVAVYLQCVIISLILFKFHQILLVLNKKIAFEHILALMEINELAVILINYSINIF